MLAAVVVAAVACSCWLFVCCWDVLLLQLPPLLLLCLHNNAWQYLSLAVTRRQHLPPMWVGVVAVFDRSTIAVAVHWLLLWLVALNNRM